MYPRTLPELVSTTVVEGGVLTIAPAGCPLDTVLAATAGSGAKLDAAVPPARIAAPCMSLRRLTVAVESAAESFARCFSSIIFLLIVGASILLQARVEGDAPA